jgi:hypothetical protein
MAAGSLIDETLAPLRDAQPWRALVAGPPQGDGWYALEEVLEGPRRLREWFDRLLDGSARGRRDVAGSYLSSYLAGIVTEPVCESAALLGRGWPNVAGNLAVHHHESGWFDGLAVLGPDVYVTDAELRAGAPGASTVGGGDALRSLLARELAALLQPMFETVRAMAPFGLRGMWGSVADGVASSLMLSAKSHGRDTRDGWRKAVELTDALAAHAAMLRVRPSIERVDSRDGSTYVPVKGTCCLYYKTHDATPDAKGEGYCLSCPRRDPDDRRRRWARYLEDEATH